MNPDTDWKKLLLKRAKGDILLQTEIDSLRLYDQCISIGLNLENEIYDFVVITSIVEAGLNLENGISAGDIKIEGKNIMSAKEYINGYLK